ncbi:MAG: hypothetical protein GX347_00845 [Epulopiscium sp.]|nr:hypothetical protein [Candidatus Epulonipiscium sp.]
MKRSLKVIGLFLILTMFMGCSKNKKIVEDGGKYSEFKNRLALNDYLIMKIYVFNI